MGVEELQLLRAKGHTIGAHSVSHAILPQCDDAQLTVEVETCKSKLEAALDTAVDTFCYPNGSHDARVRHAVDKAGFEVAVSTQWGLNAPDTTPFVLKRCDIQSSTCINRKGTFSPSRLAFRLSGHHPGLPA